MIITKVGVPFTLRGIQYILPEAGEFWQSCTNCIFYRKKNAIKTLILMSFAIAYLKVYIKNL